MEKQGSMKRDGATGGAAAAVISIPMPTVVQLQSQPKLCHQQQQHRHDQEAASAAAAAAAGTNNSNVAVAVTRETIEWILFCSYMAFCICVLFLTRKNSRISGVWILGFSEIFILGYMFVGTVYSQIRNYVVVSCVYFIAALWRAAQHL